MVDATKVQLMTKIALYENGIGKKDLRMNHWGRSAYIGIKNIETILWMTLFFVIAAGIYLFRYIPAMTDQGLRVIKQPLIYIGIMYLIVCVLVWIIGSIYFHKQYTKAHKRVVQYDKDLAELEAYLKQ